MSVQGHGAVATDPVLCLSSLEWSSEVITSRHHLSSIISERRPVLFVDPPRNVLRRAPVKTALSGESPNLSVLRGIGHLPYGTRTRWALFMRTNQRIYARAASLAASKLGYANPVLWTTYPVDFAVDLPRRLRPAAHVLHVTDELLYTWRGRRSAVDRLLSTVDVALASSPAIAQMLTQFDVDVREFGHGVDADHFGAASRRLAPARPGVEARSRPRTVFVGNFDDRVDLDILLELARGPGSLTVIGPVNRSGSDIDRLRQAGAHLEGAVSYRDLPSWLGGMDVAVLPYRMTSFVLRSRPLKLLEYLAAGLPVISTPVPTAKELAPDVMIEDDPAGFYSRVLALWDDRSVAIDAPAAREARLQRVAKFSWRRRADELETVFEDARERRRRDLG